VLPGRGRTAGLYHIEDDFACNRAINLFLRNGDTVTSRTQFMDDAMELVRIFSRQRTMCDTYWADG